MDQEGIVLVSINVNNAHWTLGVFDCQARTVGYYDSYGNYYSKAAQMLQCMESLMNAVCPNVPWAREKHHLQAARTSMPRQQNGCMLHGAAVAISVVYDASVAPCFNALTKACSYYY